MDRLHLPRRSYPRSETMLNFFQSDSYQPYVLRYRSVFLRDGAICILCSGQINIDEERLEFLSQQRATGKPRKHTKGKPLNKRHTFQAKESPLQRINNSRVKLVQHRSRSTIEITVSTTKLLQALVYTPRLPLKNARNSPRQKQL